MGGGKGVRGTPLRSGPSHCLLRPRQGGNLYPTGPSPYTCPGVDKPPDTFTSSLYKIPYQLFREAGREPLGDGGAGEGVGDAEVEVLLEVREGVRMDREGAGGL